ncbi:MAG TPA: AAA family ATPase, partial [Herpetosiphonaceae bacterium]|nr:AAA family ATPase [Herpetosiphonaceae bacterium]
MIVLLNGPFGIGKTTTAHLLVERLPDAMLLDPEEIGTFVRRLVSPIEQRDDYQDHALWRVLFVEVAGLLRETYGRTLVVPMTIWRRDYFAAIT